MICGLPANGRGQMTSTATIARGEPFHRSASALPQAGGAPFLHHVHHVVHHDLSRSRRLQRLFEARRSYRCSFDHRVDRWNDDQRQQRRRHHATDHRHGDPLHHLGAGAVAPHDREEPPHDGRDRHHFRPHALDRAGHDGSVEVGACERLLLRRSFGLQFGHRVVQVDQHHHAGLGGDAGERDEADGDRNRQIESEPPHQPDNIRRHATELAALAPDVILTFGTSTVGPLLQATRTVPIVFTLVNDPVGAGFIDSLARPGGNVTGLMTTEYGIGTKWLELLKEIALVAIEYRWAEEQYDRLPALAAELVRRRVTTMATVHGAAVARAAKAATSTIPIAFTISDDPVRLGLVASLARPGGNVTGINFVSGELVAKRLELLSELVPGAARVAVLVNPANAVQTESTLRDVEPAARAKGLQIQLLNADTSREIDAAFATLARERPDALFIASTAYFTSRRVQLVQLAARHAVPAAYVGRQYVEIGGLMGYGANIVDVWRQLGDYTGRILKGAKPADLPVQQASKFELVINHQTARMLGLTVPASLLARADEVIE